MFEDRIKLALNSTESAETARGLFQLCNAMNHVHLT